MSSTTLRPSYARQGLTSALTFFAFICLLAPMRWRGDGFASSANGCDAQELGFELGSGLLLVDLKNYKLIYVGRYAR